MPVEKGILHSGLGGNATVSPRNGSPANDLSITRGYHGEFTPVNSPFQDSSVVNARIDAYRRRYENRGHGLFSAASTSETPLLVAFDSVLGTGRKTIVEAGAGPGKQAALLAKRPETHVVAVEPNDQYSGIHETLDDASAGFGRDSQVTVIPADVNAYLAGLSEPVDGIHAHSLVHFWDENARANFYSNARRALVDTGYLAVSLKADGDAQQEVAIVDRRTLAGSYGKDPVDEGITRLFVSDPLAIAEELHAAGFELVGDVHHWEVPGYDFPDQPERVAKFVGFLARKVA